MSGWGKGTFRSLNHYNYRVWAGGALVSNIGTWMQRTAQDWLVLTHRNATAVGVVMALQFGPQVLLLPLTGYAADHYDRRKLLFATQAAMGVLALGLGLLVVAGTVTLWQVDVFAFLLGCVSAFDAPARQTFVSDLVEEQDLPNAVALNSTSFQAARMIGPAIAGVLIAMAGSGWVFLLNAASFAAVLGSLVMLRVGELHRGHRSKSSGRPGIGLMEGFRYVWGRPDLKVLFLMIFLIGTFGLNFPVFVSTMTVTVFHAGAWQYGVLSSAMAVGSIAGALLAAKREKPNMALLVAGAAAFGVGWCVAAVMPNVWLFGLVLAVIGVSAQTFTTSTNSLVQLSTKPEMRGRVMAILLAIALGGTPLGAPVVGWVADRLGPAWALAIGGVSGLAAAAVGLSFLMKRRLTQSRSSSLELEAGEIGQPSESQP
jgi:MFS family permease